MLWIVKLKLLQENGGLSCLAFAGYIHGKTEIGIFFSLRRNVKYESLFD